VSGLILDHRGDPVSGHVYPVRRRAAGSQDTLSNWFPSRVSAWQEERDRKLAGMRAEDLVAGDAHAAGLVDTIATNTVGVGLNPQSRVDARRLELAPDQARDFQDSAERAWKIWCREADAGERMTFGGIQWLNIRTMLTQGEFLTLPLMVTRPGRTFSLALQDVHPARLGTPTDKASDHALRSGVRLGDCRQPVGYYVANPLDGLYSSALDSAQYRFYPAWRGHRPQVIHRFHSREPEQVRGEPVLNPAMKFFRDLGDYLDYELVANIVTAMFPVFVETLDPAGMAAAVADEGGAPGEAGRGLQRYQTYEAGQVLYGEPGQRPHMLSANRPGGSFGIFVERILRAIGAAVGMPYEVFTKDFSKTNYSSARAALLEAWRVFTLYRTWLRDSFCQLIWELVLEEAWLLGLLTLPASAPDFYDARHDYCAAEWIGPARGHVDPVKEMQADIAGLEAGVLTLSDVVAARGGDWESVAAQRAREKAKLEELGLSAATGQAAARLGAIPPEPEKEDAA